VSAVLLKPLIAMVRPWPVPYMTFDSPHSADPTARAINAAMTTALYGVISAYGSPDRYRKAEYGRALRWPASGKPTGVGNCKIAISTRWRRSIAHS